MNFHSTDRSSGCWETIKGTTIFCNSSYVMESRIAGQNALRVMVDLGQWHVINACHLNTCATKLLNASASVCEQNINTKVTNRMRQIMIGL